MARTVGLITSASTKMTASNNPSLLSKEQIAEALELASDGWYWQNIADKFGVSASALMRYVRAAERYGYSFWSQYPKED